LAAAAAAEVVVAVVVVVRPGGGDAAGEKSLESVARGAWISRPTQRPHVGPASGPSADDDAVEAIEARGRRKIIDGAEHPPIDNTRWWDTLRTTARSI